MSESNHRVFPERYQSFSLKLVAGSQRFQFEIAGWRIIKETIIVTCHQSISLLLLTRLFLRFNDIEDLRSREIPQELTRIEERN